MSLNNEAVRLAYLQKSNKRANQSTLNVPLSRRLEGKKYGRGKKMEMEEEISDSDMKGGAMMMPNRVIGGAKKRGRPKKQTQKDKEDERLAMEIHDLDEDVEGGAYSYGGKKATKAKKPTKAQMKKQAKMMGEDYGKNIAEMDEEARELVGGGFIDDFAKGFKQGIGLIAKPAKEVLSVIPNPVAQTASAGLSLAGFGKAKDGMTVKERKAMEKLHKAMSEDKKGGALTGGKKKRAKATGGDKRKQRGAMISKLMKSKGMTLGQASKFIKENDLI